MMVVSHHENDSTQGTSCSLRETKERALEHRGIHDDDARPTLRSSEYDIVLAS